MSVCWFAALCLIAADTSELSPARINDLWRMHWPRYASQYVKIGDGYAACAKYDRDFPSSRLATVEELRQETKRTRRVTIGNFEHKKTAQTPTADARAYAYAIPRLEVGEYGYIHSAEIDQILSPTEMIVEKIRLISTRKIRDDKKEERRKLEKKSTARGSSRAVETQLDWKFQKRDKLAQLQDDSDFDRRIKLVGYDTVGRTRGDRWPIEGETDLEDGAQIAIVKEIPRERRQRRSRRLSLRRRDSSDGLLVAVDAQRFQFRELDEKQFLKALHQRGYDKARFVELVLLQKKRKSQGAEARVIAALEQAAGDLALKQRELDRQKLEEAEQQEEKMRDAAKNAEKQKKKQAREQRRKERRERRNRRRQKTAGDMDEQDDDSKDQDNDEN